MSETTACSIRIHRHVKLIKEHVLQKIQIGHKTKLVIRKEITSFFITINSFSIAKALAKMRKCYLIRPLKNGLSKDWFLF